MTLVRTVYEKLKLDILAGKIEPGSKLRFSKLKEDYSASMGVLREVLSLLSGEGLVKSINQQGFEAMSVSLEDLRDLIETRCLVEVHVLRDSIARGDLDWETRIVSAHHKMKRTPKEDVVNDVVVTEGWAAAHQKFHDTLISASTLQRLTQFTSTMRAAAEVYRHWSIAFELKKRDVDAEHDRLVQLCIDRDIEGACAALDAHLRLTGDLILTGAPVSN